MSVDNGESKQLTRSSRRELDKSSTNLIQRGLDLSNGFHDDPDSRTITRGVFNGYLNRDIATQEMKILIEMMDRVNHLPIDQIAEKGENYEPTGYPDYHQVILDLFGYISTSKFWVDYDYSEKLDILDVKECEEMNLDELKVDITRIWRAIRFNHWFWVDLITDGYLKRIQARLEKLLAGGMK